MNSSISPHTPAGSVLLNDVIKKCIDKWHLIEDYDYSCIQPAGYDARIGLDYYREGVVERFDLERKPWIEVEPNHMIMVSTLETFSMPTNLVARYYLRQGLTWKGLVLLGAGQIDPGYHGKIYGLLFNFSRNMVRINAKEHIFTIEFCYTTEPTEFSRSYTGDYQGSLSIASILPKGITISSGIEGVEDRLKGIIERIEHYQRQSEKQSERLLFFLGVIIALFALLEVVVSTVSLVVALISVIQLLK
jgi:deoxycytidine triphosphate deaminase